MSLRQQPARAAKQTVGQESANILATPTNTQRSSSDTNTTHLSEPDDARDNVNVVESVSDSTNGTVQQLTQTVAEEMGDRIGSGVTSPPPIDTRRR